MRIEHKLSPVVAQAVRRMIDQLNEQETQRLSGLGKAKEAELTIVMIRSSLSQQLSIVQDSEKLPASTAPYTLSPDGLSLIGEAADPPAEETKKASAVAPSHANGKTHDAAAQH